MKKCLLGFMLLMCFGFMVYPSASKAAGTADNWNMTLTFSTSDKTPMFPLTLGVSPTQEKKITMPPTMPGQITTSSDDDSIFAVNMMDQDVQDRELLYYIKQYNSDALAYVWPIKLYNETGLPGANVDVTVTADLTNAVSGQKIWLVIPQTRTRFHFQDKENTHTFPFSGTEISAYVVVGDSGSIIWNNENTIEGVISLQVMGFDLSGLLESDLSGFTVELQGTDPKPTTKTDENGFFSFEGQTIPPGTYTVRADDEYSLASDPVDSSFSFDPGIDNVSYFDNPNTCDANGDNTCFLDDLVLLRKCLGMNDTDTNPSCEEIIKIPFKAVDFIRDGTIDTYDLVAIRKCYGKDESGIPCLK